MEWHSIRAVNRNKTVVQQNWIKAVQQNWNALKQKASLLLLSLFIIIIIIIFHANSFILT